MSNIVLNREEVIRRIELNNPGKFDFSPLDNWEYDHKRDWNQPITLICKKHNEPFEISLQCSIKNSFECPLCTAEIKRERCVKKVLKNLEKFFPNKYEFLKLDNRSAITLQCYATLKCKDCGEIFEIKLDTIRSCYRQASLCKKCKIKWSTNLYLERLKLLYGNQYELISNFISISNTVTLKCKYCESVYEVKANMSLAKPPCKCLKEKMTPSVFIKKSKEIWGEDTFEYIDFDLNYHSQNVTLKCKKHNEIFTQKYPNHLGHYYGCPQCRHEMNSSRKLLSNEEFIKRCKIIYKDQFSYELTLYKGYRNDVIVTCKDHGPIAVKAESLLRGAGCPLCRRESSLTSKGEKFLLNFLEKNNINFNYQKTFEECVYKNPLKFDFYLPDYNLCIEYQGIQHYKPVTFGKLSKDKAEKNFKVQQIRDQIKREFCKKENIKLIEISYNKKLYKVEKELIDYLNLNKPL